MKTVLLFTLFFFLEKSQFVLFFWTQFQKPEQSFHLMTINLVTAFTEFFKYLGRPFLALESFHRFNTFPFLC